MIGKPAKNSFFIILHKAEFRENIHSHPKKISKTWVPMNLISYFVLVNAGLFFRWLHWEVVDECEKVSSQCADAGFGFEPLAAYY